MVKFTVCKYNPRIIGQDKTLVKLACFKLPNTFNELVDNINMHRAGMLRKIGQELGYDFKCYYRDKSEGYLIFIGSNQ